MIRPRATDKSNYGAGLRPLAAATVAVLAVALCLVFFYAPLDADQGFIQKIFYLHVPLAMTALIGFMVGAGTASSTCARATPPTTCAPTWPSTCR